jgi:hypothetical protein
VLTLDFEVVIIPPIIKAGGPTSLKQLHEELCVLVGAISASSRVMFIRIDKRSSKAKILATTLGEKIEVAIDLSLGFLEAESPILLVPNIKAEPKILKSAFLKFIPHAKSVAGYFIQETTTHRWIILAWNPNPNYFKDDTALAHVERIIGLCKKVIDNKYTMEEEAFQYLQKESEQTILKEDVFKYEAEPLLKFLIETLVPKQRLLGRNGVSYLALRQWRQSIKPYQIKAVEAIKSSQDEVCMEVVAGEIVQHIQKIYGNLFTSVVPVPGGSSGTAKSLSVLLAEQVAKKLKIPCNNILVAAPVATGKSHPKKSAVLKPYSLREKISGNILILDDVVTSGRHIELATMALRTSAEFCTAVAWISD